MIFNYIISLLLISSLAHAVGGGGQEGNGGGGVQEVGSGKNTLLDLAEQEDMVPVEFHPDREFDSELFTEVFQFRTYVSPKLQYAMVIASQVRRRAPIFIDAGDFPPGWQLDHGILKPLWPPSFYFTQKELKDVPDEGTIRVGSPYSKVQIGMQKDGVILINEPAFKKLDDRNKTAFLLHEYVLFATLQYNPQILKDKGTEPIRTYVRRIIQFAEGRLRRTEAVPQEWVNDSMKALQF